MEGSEERMDVMPRGLTHYDSRLAGYLEEAGKDGYKDYREHGLSWRPEYAMNFLGFERL